METLVLPEKMIEAESTKLVNKLDSSKGYLGKFDSIGSNAIFEAKPMVLNYGGYEVKKTQSLKLTIKNVSESSQRLSILPTMTPFFKAFYNKKGLLAPGMSEVLAVQFTPPEWRYYYDCLRLLTSGGNINIPIHAYPIMNSNERYIPSLIDLGKCFVGQRAVKTIELECTVPVTFEYEIKVLESSPDILIGPVSGEVKGKSVTTLEITYTPRSASTSVCEIEFMLSEFGFKPIRSRIIGSATHSSPSKAEKTSKSLLMSSKDSTVSKKLPEISKFTKTMTKAAQSMIAPKTIDRLIYEQQFNNEYRKLEEYDREKEFKIYVSLGNSHPLNEFVEKVHKDRDEKDFNRLRTMKKTDFLRNSHEIDKDKSIVPVEFFPESFPTWNVYQNDDFSLRILPLNRFVRAASTIITRLRADKRIKLIKDALHKHGVKTREDARQFVSFDWKQTDMIGVGKQDFIPFSYSIQETLIKQTSFPEQHTDALDDFKKTLEITPLNNFDTYFSLPLIEPQDYLLANYPDIILPPSSHYLPQEKDREARQGAEDEYSICQEKGDYREDPVFSVPSNSEKPLAIDSVSVVRPHPSLRCYLSLTALTETSSEYLLTPAELPRSSYEEFPGFFIPSPYMLCNKWRPKGVYTQVKIAEKLKGPSAAEALSESDSDNENAVGLETPSLDSYLAMFEADDENIKLAAKTNAKADSLNSLSEDIEKNKQRDIAWLPTQITSINKLVQEPELKLSIL